jgi:hypothetical protein
MVNILQMKERLVDPKHFVAQLILHVNGRLTAPFYRFSASIGYEHIRR